MNTSASQLERGRRRTATTATNRYVKLVAGLFCFVAVGLVIYLLSAWQTRDFIDGTYGKSKGIEGGKSVNGTAILAELFRESGVRVGTWKRLSPRLRKADVIVWFPDDMSPPSDEHCAWFKSWFQESSEQPKTLVYVGRDFDARIAYWETVMPRAPADQANEIRRRLAHARVDHDMRRQSVPPESTCPWFQVLRNWQSRQVHALRGPWSSGVDAPQSSITLASQFHFDDAFVDDDFDIQRLLTAPGLDDGDSAPLVTRLAYAGSDQQDQKDHQILVVTNGSFLLNLPLVNHEHRKLASRLVQACGEPQEVVLLESQAGGPAILNTDRVERPPGAMQMMSVWPLSAIITHVVALGILLCFALFPIFGHPRALDSPPRSDFSKHIDSLGRLLAKSGDIGYATTKIQYYQQRVRRDSGASHRQATDAERPVTPDTATDTQL